MIVQQDALLGKKIFKAIISPQSKQECVWTMSLLLILNHLISTMCSTISELEEVLSLEMLLGVMKSLPILHMPLRIQTPSWIGLTRKFNFSVKMLWKNMNEPFDQPNILLL